MEIQQRYSNDEQEAEKRKPKHDYFLGHTAYFIGRKRAWCYVDSNFVYVSFGGFIMPKKLSTFGHPAL